MRTSAVAAAFFVAAAAAELASSIPPGVVTTSGPSFSLDGRPFRYGGANTYYLHYHPQADVDDALERAARNNMTVLRIWTFLQVDECVPASPWGVPPFQCWSDAAKDVVVNTTAAGLALDYILQKAGQVGVRLVLTLANNWDDFGGMDAYVGWRVRRSNATGEQPPFVPYHDSFFSDSTIRGWYKAWVSALVTRTNALTGVPYSRDPSIFAWQLANEPRCSVGDKPYPSSPSCVKNHTLTQWADEMSSYVRSLDQVHMISVGDEGFPCLNSTLCPGYTWWCDCSTGVDTLALAALPAVSYGTAHLYPESWGTDADAAGWGAAWIANHTRDLHDVVGKPFVVEEFGITDLATQKSTYDTWTATAVSNGTDGFNVWMLVGTQDGGKEWYPGDALNIVCREEGSNDPPVPSGHDGTTCALLSARAAEMQGGRA
jgi:mannan endo-1,4-beta-mannosidase